MKITLTHIQGTVPVSVLNVEGSMDGSNYQDLVEMAQELYEGGTCNLLLDLSKLTFISSAGISALHRTTLIFSGKGGANIGEGLAAFRALGRDRDQGQQQSVKLLNPSQEVRGVLDMVGFSPFFEIHDNLQDAVASFQ